MRKTVFVLLAAVLAAGEFGCRSHAKPAPTAPPRAQQSRPQHQPPPPPQHVQQPPRPQPPPPRRPQYAGPAWYPARKPISPRWTTIVIHHSATDRGSAATFDQDHRSRGWEGLGYHFVIGNGKGSGDGQIEVSGRWHEQKHGAHCKTADNYFNEHGIGICLVGDFTKYRPTARQMQSLQQLVAFLTDRCNIRAERVTTHGAVTGKTLCPGRHFSLQNVRRTLLTGGARQAAR